MAYENFRFQAHRGDSFGYPENTLVSYQAAIDQKYHVIELDNKFTKDNVCICLHDHLLNRTCRNEDGSELSEKLYAHRLTLEEIKKFDAGLFKGEQFRGTRVPTLEETLDLVRGKDIALKFDNVFQSFSEGWFEIFCDTIKNANMEKQVGFTCYSLPYLMYMAEKFPEAELHFDGSLTKDALAYIKHNVKDRTTLWIPYDNADTSWCNERKASVEYCRDLHEYGKVGIWLIGETDELRAAVKDFGADIIETNGKIKPTDLSKI